MEAGLDEAGRGCLAGPVVAAAVILAKEFEHPLLRDSKKLTHHQRELLEGVIKKEAISYGIGVIDNEIIDEINILKASFRAMNKAVSQLNQIPQLLLVDGNRFQPEYDIPFKCIVKGDDKYNSIAAASILAKTYRDRLMAEFDKKYPFYNWKQNKGYPTQEHKNAIIINGICPLHRKSFRLFDNERQLEFGF
jgi:ribonuclease HII